MTVLERERSLADLSRWLGQAGQGEGCIVLVAGEAGIGKTTLVQSFSSLQRDARVLWGACDALFTPRPLAPLHDIARQTQGFLSVAMNAGSSRDIVFSAVLDELERGPTLVVFEDIHWADDATFDLLKYLGRRIHRTRAMLVATYRDDEIGPQHSLRFVIGDMPRASTRRIQLAPLSEAAVAQLASEAKRPSENLYGITGGNPFFVTELLASGAEAVPVTVRDAVLARAAKLSPSAREIAEIVAVVPGKAEMWLVEQLVQPSAADLEDCLSIGMVRSEDAALAFRHELARRALQDSLTSPRRQSLHAKVLGVLAQREDVPVARLTHHADGARDAEQVIRFAPIAAEQASAVGAHSEALAHYQTALRYGERLPQQERARLLELLSYECYLTGQHERAIDPRRQALEIWRAVGEKLREGDNQRWLSRLTWYVGRKIEAKNIGVEAVATLESLPPSVELAMAYGNLAHLDMESHETESAVRWAQRAIDLAKQRGRDDVLIHALTVAGTARLIEGEAGGWHDLERSLQLALAHGSQDEIGRSYASLAAMAISRRQYASASRYQTEGLAYCEKRDLDSWWLYMVAGRARMRFEQGDWHGACDDVEAVLRHPRATPITRIPVLETLGHVRIRRGDPDSTSPLEEARKLAGPQPDLQRIGRLAVVFGEAAWLEGDHEAVVQAVEPAYVLAAQRRDPRMRGELSAWLFRVGALKEPAGDVAEPYALEISGAWRAAAKTWQELGCPYERACLLAWHGDEAERREALSIFTALGAHPAAQALRKQMRNQGVRGVPRGSRKSTQANPHGLTRREAQIAVLLGEGLQNAAIAKRLFLSTKTVEHHVSAVLRKLGAQTRAQAGAIARKASDDAA